MKKSDDSGFGLVVDGYWAHAGGFSARVLADEWGEKVRAVHLKDGDPSKKTFHPLGKGRRQTRLQSEVAIAQEHEVSAVVYEQDDALSDGVDRCVSISGAWLRSAFTQSPSDSE